MGRSRWIFQLTETQACEGYDRVEIRKDQHEGRWIYLDDVSITADPESCCAINGIDASVEITGGTIEQFSEPCELEAQVLCEAKIRPVPGGECEIAQYMLVIEELDLTNCTAGTVSYTTGIVQGTPPTEFNTNALPTNAQYPFGFVPIDGKFYKISWGVAGSVCNPTWNWDVSYIKYEECCPEELILEVDCEQGLVSIVNLPNNATGLYTTWYYSKKTPSSGYGQVITSGTGTIGSVQTGNAGYYTVEIQFELSNGTICTQVVTIYYNPENCCEENGPTPNLDFPTGNIDQVSTPYGMINVIWYCEGDDIPMRALPGLCEVDEYMLSGAPFDPQTWGISPWMFTTNTVNTAPPISMDLNTINGGPLPIGYYWIEYAVGSPLNYSYTIIEIRDCSAEPKGRVSGSATSIGTNDIQVSLFPNPTAENVNVSFDGIQTGSAVVVSADGKALSSTEFKNCATFEINTVELPAGLYYINVTIEGQVITKKLIKE